MILTDRLVIVVDCPLVTGLNQEIVVVSKMLVVMNEASNDHGAKIKVVQVEDTHKVAANEEVVCSLRHINAVSLVVISNIFVAILNSLCEVIESVRINHHLSEQIVFSHHESSDGYQLIAFSFFCYVEHIENISVNQLQLTL